MLASAALTVSISRRAGAGKRFCYNTHSKRVKMLKSRKIARSAS